AHLRDWSRGIDRYGYSVTVRHGSGGYCRHALAGHDDSSQVEGVGGGKYDGFARRLFRAHRSQRLDGDREGKLLAEESGNEPASAHFTSVFQAAQSDQQFSPFGDDGLSSK